MKFYLLLLSGLLSLVGGAQTYGLETEVVAEDIGMLVGALGVTDMTGYSCTRLYVKMNNEDDFMSSVSGDLINPTYVNTTTDFYHAILGTGTPNGINSLLFGVYPDLEYDSWITIGIEGAPNAMAGEGNVSTVQATDNPWLTNFDPGGGLAGGNLAIDDLIGGAWYALNGDSNGIAGSDLKVLVGQFTTTGEISGQVYCKIFINGDGSNEFRNTFYFGELVIGCVDTEACNYNAEAITDDNSCEYVCGGCTDNTACNYSHVASYDDGSCCYANCWTAELALPEGVGGIASYVSASGEVLDSLIIPWNSGPGEVTYSFSGCSQGECGFFELDSGLHAAGTEFLISGAWLALVAGTDQSTPLCFGGFSGCEDETACNYHPLVTEDDGTCTYPNAVTLNCDGACLNDSDLDGICDENEPYGCADPLACNHNPAVDYEHEDGSCTYEGCYGCLDSTACNYDDTATLDDLCAPTVDPLLGMYNPSGNYSVRIDTIVSDIGLIQNALGSITDLTGYSSIRVYATVDDEQDAITAITGFPEQVTFVGTQGDLYHHPVLGQADVNFSANNTLLYSVYPELEFSSMLTLKFETTQEFYATPEHSNQSWPVWPTTQSGGIVSPWLDSLVNGASFQFGLGCSQIFAPDSLGVEAFYAAGDTKEILIGRFTSNEPVSGEIQCLMTNGTSTGLRSFSFGPQVIGCTDTSACNFDSVAVYNDSLLCAYELDVCGVCGGDSEDINENGLCDETEEQTCDDPAACNYDATALPFVPPPTDDSYCLELRTIQEHVSGELEGLTTYQLYLHCEHPEDRVTAVYGDSSDTLEIRTSGTFYHSEIGGVTPDLINPFLFPFYPTLPFDSWVTIGYDQSVNTALGQSAISVLASEWNNWANVFDPGAGEPGGDINIADDAGGLWYLLPQEDGGPSNAYPTADSTVLLGQFTTDGIVSGRLNIQILNEEVPPSGEDLRLHLDIGGNCALQGNPACTYPMSSVLDCAGACVNDLDADQVCDEYELLGCTDSLACNFNTWATEELGNCMYFDALGICGGSCIADEDGDLVCDDEDDCVGEYDQCEVCNGNGAAYDCGCFGVVVGECDCQGNVLDAAGVCGGDCLLDADGDGVCDDDEIMGCTDPCACNFEPEATEDNGNCLGLDALSDCGGSCSFDLDQDGICDDIDECVGAEDECGLCNGPGAAFECGCAGVALGQCDCEGNELDALGVCGGNCAFDLNGNGVCDSMEPALCGLGTYWSAEEGSCVYFADCPTDVNGDGSTGIADLLELLASFATFCE